VLERVRAGATQSTIEDKLQAQLDEYLAPARSPNDYRFERIDPGPLPAEAIALEKTIREAFHSAQMPVDAARTITYSMEQTAAKTARMKPAELEAMTAKNEAGLRSMWGEQFDANLRTVDDYLEQIARHSSKARATVERSAGLLSPTDINLLLTVANRRAARSR
jgi:hypothetical protein